MYNIRMGIPEMEDLWNNLCSKTKSGTASKDEAQLYKKLGKAMYFLSENPRHPGLESHEISSLTRRYGMKVWQSYLENRKPAAGRIFWVYGPDRMDITIIGLEPHPDDKTKSYDMVTLSSVGEPLQ